MQIQNCVSIVQVLAGVVDGRVIPKMGNCDFGVSFSAEWAALKPEPFLHEPQKRFGTPRL